MNYIKHRPTSPSMKEVRKHWFTAKPSEKLTWILRAMDFNLVWQERVWNNWLKAIDLFETTYLFSTEEN